MADGEFVVTAVEEQYYKVEDTRGWHPLFQRLQQIAKAQAGPQTEARRPTNIPRNRYRDVLPNFGGFMDHLARIKFVVLNVHSQ
uniref:Uncharacterized protein n=1 Tax=Amphimedon queenslandica TaxID=400682 RepID=A0A1X7SML4_AMPQE